MNDLRNPYIAGAPVVESSMFFGREDVFRWIENSLTGKYIDHILVLHGQRRVGKTTVLKQIPNFLPKTYIQVFYDLQGRTNTTLDRFLWWMASEVVRTLNKEAGLDLTRPDRKAFTDPEAFLSEFLPGVQQSLDGHTLLLTFDEFDTLSRPDIQESLARPLINFLRRLFEVENLNFIFSIGSSGNKLENMQAAYTNFFKTALYRKVSFLTEAECVKLIQEPVKGIIQYDPAAVARISQVTSGHPYFTQLTCHELFARCQASGSRRVTRQDVEEILDDVIERGTVNLKFVWDEASNLEKWILAALAQEEGLSQKQIGETLTALGVRFSDSDLNSAVLHLRDKDVLTQKNTFIIRLMKRWLEKNRPMDRVREELVQTNPIADRYIEIGDELHDRGQWEDALQSYQQALDFQENNLTALMKIAEIHLEQEQISQAVSAFEKTLLVDSEHIAARHGYCQAMLALGDQARGQGDVDAAIDSYKAILNLTPVHAEARQNLAEIYRERAEAYLSSGDDQAGLEALRQALEMTPEDQALQARTQQVVDQKKAALVQSWLDKAQRAIHRKRWDEASQMADQALAVDPEDEELQAKVAAVKDAPRQAKLAAYQGEAARAIEAQKFDQAIQALEAALLLAPDNDDLQNRLQAVQRDHRQARLDHFNAQAEAAIAVGDWDAALAARQHALKIDPEDKDLQGALADTQAAQKQAGLDHFNTQAEQAVKAGDWNAALAAREKALAIDPEDPTLTQALEDTRAAQHQAQIDALQGSLQTAREAGRWEAAIQAAHQLIDLEPEEEQWQDLLAELEATQRQARLQDLLDQGQTAYKNQDWPAALQAWEAYLKEEPEEREKFQDRLGHAQKYAQIQADYQKAQGLIKSRRFDKAIPLLQGIIAQDPTYQATSRLLVEAVEAREERQPIWRKPWFYASLAGVLLVLAGLLFGDNLISLFSHSDNPTPEPIIITKDVTATPNAESDNQEPVAVVDAETAAPSENTAAVETPSPEPTQVPAYELVLAAIEDQPPTFEDDFSSAKPEWEVHQPDGSISSSGNAGDLSNGKLTFVDGDLQYTTENLQGRDFVISTDIVFGRNSDLNSPSGFGGQISFLLFSNDEKTEYIRLNISPTRGIQLQQLLTNGFTQIDDIDFFGNENTTIDIISFDSTLILIIADRVIFSEEVSNTTGEKIIFFGADQEGIPSLDNFKFWNLEGVEIAAAETPSSEETSTAVQDYEPVLAAVEEEPPTIELQALGTFNEWTFERWDLTGEDFVISTTINFPQRGGQSPSAVVGSPFSGQITFWLLTNNEKTEYVSIWISPNQHLLQQKVAGQTQFLDREPVLSKETISAKIIVFDGNLTLLVDNEEIFSEEIDNTSGEKILIFGEGSEGSPTMDDFQFWNLEDVVIN